MKTTAVGVLIQIIVTAASLIPASGSDWISSHYTKQEYMIPMRDGIKLYTAVYLPRDESEKHPFLLMRTPYSCMPYGTGRFTDRYETRKDSMYFHRHYIMVYQDVRGRHMSEGAFEDVRPFLPQKRKKTDTDEASDAYDTIDWLLKNIKNHNGRVGCHGISYPGFYATMAAASAHPALKAVSPQAPVTDWFIGDDFHHNGVPFIMDAFDFFRGFGVRRSAPVSRYPAPPPLSYPDNYSFFLESGTYKEIKDSYMGDTIKFWNDVQNHPNYDAWWQQRDARKATVNLLPAMLVVGGLFDAEDCWGGWNLYKAVEKNSPGIVNQVVYGPWWHGGWKRSTGEQVGNIRFGQQTSEYYCRRIELPFFEYYLRGIGSVTELAEATVFITGQNEWQHFGEWPPAGIKPTALFFREGEKLSFSAGTVAEGFDEYVSDPMKPVPYAEAVHSDRTREYMTDDQRFASRRTDVLVYKTEKLAEDVTVTGPVSADLFVSLTGTDADFVVKLIDVFPDDFRYPDSVKNSYPMGGYEMLVRGEIMRGRFRNSFENPEPFVPGEITEVKFELPDVAHTFKKGHRIMIQVQSTWYPLADRNPQQFVDPYQCETEDLKKCTIRVYRDAGRPSSVVLPVLPR